MSYGFKHKKNKSAQNSFFLKLKTHHPPLTTFSLCPLFDARVSTGYNTSMKSSQYVALFVDEAGLLLEQCQSCLEQLEDNVPDPGLYRELFRLIHTLKGMAATLVELPFFEDITQLSHNVEALLEPKNQSLPQDQLFLLADSFQALGELIRNVASPEQSVTVPLEPLFQRFSALDPSAAAVANPLNRVNLGELQPLALDAQEQDRAQELQAQGMGLYEVHVELMQACLMKSVRALLVLHNLEQQTEILTTQPPLGLLREGTFEDGFSVLVATELSPVELGELAESVSEIENVSVLAFNTSTNSESEPPQTAEPAFVADSAENKLNEFELRLLEEASRMKLNSVWLRFKILRSVQMRAARIALIFNQLEQHGEVIKTLPTVSELEADHFDDQFELLVITPENPDSLRQHLLEQADIQNWLTLEAHFHGQGQLLDSVPLPVPPEVSTLRIGSAGGETRESLPLPQANELVESERLKNIRLQHLVRVDAQQLQLLSVLTSELLLTRARLNQVGSGSKQMRQELAGLNRITASLQAISMKLQTVSATHVFHRYPRMIRDLARSLGKEIICTLSGEDVEISRAYVDDLSSVLLHMIRNAADHGLEAPADRLRQGKSRQGSIHLSAAYRDSQVVIEVRDDGRGIDVEALKRKALNQKLITQEESETLDDDQAMHLIFSPGLSTSSAATDISGRGVGMDVVRNHISQVGGHLQVDSNPGEGTHFTIWLPSEFRQVRSLLVRAEQQYYALPYEQVAKIRQGAESDHSSEQGSLIALQNLSADTAEENLRPESVLLQIRNGDQPVWLLADELIGAQDLAVRDLSYDSDELVRGAAMLGSEDVALYLEPERLLRLADGVSIL